MSGAAARMLWCTTCGEYVRPGTHGIHAMRFTAGTDPHLGRAPETSSAAVVAVLVLVIAGSGVLLLVSAMLVFGRT
jgi:hypothetical protein